MIRVLAVLAILAVDALAEVSAQDAPGIAACSSSHAVDRRTGKPVPSQCGPRVTSRGAPHMSVTGGRDAPDERYTAAIFYRNENGQENICTGVLIDTNHLLTAGHCGCGLDGSYSVSFSQNARRAGQIVDRIGIKGAPILFDPLTCVSGAAPGKDLALLRLERSIMETKPDYVGYPIYALAFDYLPQMARPQPLKVVGYGLTETGRVASRMMASVPVLTPNCLGVPYKFYCSQFEEMILADRTGSGVARDTCEGDSGGPVYVRAEVRLARCQGRFQTLGTPYENVQEGERLTVEQDVLVAITSRAAPFTQPLVGGHCGGGSINTLIGRQSVYAWFDANHVRPQRCVVAPN